MLASTRHLPIGMRTGAGTAIGLPPSCTRRHPAPPGVHAIEDVTAPADCFAALAGCGDAPVDRRQLIDLTIYETESRDDDHR